MIDKISSFFSKLFESRSKFSHEKKSESIDGLYFHEEFSRQVALYPYENYGYLKSKNEQSRSFAKSNSDENGLANAIYVIEEKEPSALVDKKIGLSEIGSICLNFGFEKVENIYSGYNPDIYKQDSFVGYAFKNAEIFVSFEGETAIRIYLNGFRFQRDPEVKATLQNVLFQIGTAFNLIANDWNLGEIIDLISMEKVEAYLNS